MSTVLSVYGLEIPLHEFNQESIHTFQVVSLLIIDKIRCEELLDQNEAILN